MDADTYELLRESIRALLQSRSDDLVTGLAQLGWDEVVSEDAAAAVDMLFTELGALGRASHVLDGILIDSGGGDLRGSSTEPLAVIHPLATATCARDALLRIDGVVLRDPCEVTGGVVAVPGDDTTVYVLGSERLATATTPVRGFDPDSALHRVRLSVAAYDVEELKSDWATAMAAGRRALAAELLGNGRTMLDTAVEHVGQRMQFGRPIGANQAPRHSLAHCYTLLEGARELVRVSWNSGTAWDALVAKAYAGYASETTASSCMQVCGAMGVTSEHSLGGFVKRARILDGLYGGWRRSTQRIGRSLLCSKTIPVGPPL